jgi:hypothetical protein
LDRAAKQQQFLGQGGLAGVPIRNDRKAPPTINQILAAIKMMVNAAIGIPLIA